MNYCSHLRIHILQVKSAVAEIANMHAAGKINFSKPNKTHVPATIQLCVGACVFMQINIKCAQFWKLEVKLKVEPK
jgi:hypothetical protein